MPLPEQTFVQLDKAPIEGQLATQLVQLAPDLDIGSRGNSETPSALDLPINGAETSSLSGGRGMDYVRQDGTVEHATSREEALRLCPVLGRMALQNPESANLLLDLAELGRAKMDDEAHQKMSTKSAQDHESNTVKPEAPKVEMSEKSPALASPAVVPERSTTELSKTRQLLPGKEPMDPTNNLQPSVNLDHGAQEVRRILDQVEGNSIVETGQAVETAATPKIITSVELRGSQDGRNLVTEVAVNERPAARVQSQTVESQSVPAQKKTHPKPTAREKIEARPTADDSQQARPKRSVVQWPERTVQEAKEHFLPVVESGQRVSRQNITPRQIKFSESAKPADTSESIDRELQVYEDFSETLAQMAETTEHAAVNQFDEPTKSDAPSEALRDKIEPVPAVVQVLVQRMSELETSSQAELAPQVTSVMEAVQHIDQSYSVSPEVAQVARKKLASAVADLFEQLDLEYEVADVEQFIAVIMRPDFASLVLPAANFAEVDLETDGTREAKKRLASAAADLVAGTGYSLERLLGVIILIGLTAGRVAKAA